MIGSGKIGNENTQKQMTIWNYEAWNGGQKAHLAAKCHEWCTTNSQNWNILQTFSLFYFKSLKVSGWKHNRFSTNKNVAFSNWTLLNTFFPQPGHACKMLICNIIKSNWVIQESPQLLIFRFITSHLAWSSFSLCNKKYPESCLLPSEILFLKPFKRTICNFSR